MFFRSCLLFGLLFNGLPGLKAQMHPPRRYGGQNLTPRMETVRINGLLKDRKSGVLLIATENQGDLLIGVNPRTQIAFTGEATPAFLRPGMCVAFKATVDLKGNVTDKIEGLSVFTPSMAKPIGLFPKAGDQAEPERPKKTAKKSKDPAA